MQIRGQQYKYRGHIVHFLRDVGKVYRQLPLLPPELDVILLRPPNASEHTHLNRQFRRQFRVRRRCLQQGGESIHDFHGVDQYIDFHPRQRQSTRPGVM
jgi:hypothetical protein